MELFNICISDKQRLKLIAALKALPAEPAAQARSAGMIAANVERTNAGLALAYSYKDFFYEADNLDRLSVEVRSQVE